MKFVCRHVAGTSFLLVTLATITACGGGSAPPPEQQQPPPPPLTYSIGGTVSGLDTGQSIVLQDNGVDSLRVSDNGPFTFATKVASGGTYAVALMEYPGFTTCTITGGSGVASTSVTSVVVACVRNPRFSIGGSVSGLVGGGLRLALRAPCGYACSRPSQFITVDTTSASANGSFAFQSPQYAGQYVVVVDTQPSAPVQHCVVTDPIVALAAQNITDVTVACAEFAYVANSSGNTVSAFSIDATNGAIAAAASPVAAGSSPTAMVNTLDNRHLFVGNRDSNDISAFSVDPGSGALTAIPGSPVATGMKPRALLLHPTGSSDNPTYFPDYYLYVANGGSNDLSAYKFNQDTGTLTPLSPPSYATGINPSAIATAHSTSTSGRASFIYIANTGGAGDISAFVIDEPSGGLTPIAGSPFPSADSVSSLAVGRSNASEGFLYAANASGSAAAIYGFRVDPNGVLTSLTGFPFGLPSCSNVLTDQTGVYLYATAGTNVLGYSIDAQTGALSPLPGFPVAIGVNATSLSVDPTNQFLYVANGNAGTVTSFKLDAASGALAPMPGSPFAVGNSADVVTTF